MNGGGMRAGLVVAVGLLVLYLAATGKLGRIPSAWRALQGQPDTAGGTERPAFFNGQAPANTPAQALNPLPPVYIAPRDLDTMLAGQQVVRG